MLTSKFQPYINQSTQFQPNLNVDIRLRWLIVPTGIYVDIFKTPLKEEGKLRCLHKDA